MDRYDAPGSGAAAPGSTASSLIAGVKILDPDAWRRLVALYGPLVYGWSRRAGLSGEDAADITQEVFRSVAARVGSMRRDRPDDTFRGWLWTITHNKLRDLWRARVGRPVAAGGSDAQERLLLVPESDPNSVSGLLATERDGVLRRAVELVRGDFEERSWQAFWRVTVDGQAAADVARELGVSPNAVYVARSRILRRLREVLSGDATGPSSGSNAE